MKRRLLILTRYDSLGASWRILRTPYCRAFKAAGFEVSVRPLFTNQYLRELYRDKRKSSISVIACYFRRFLDLRHSVDFDLIWVEKELFPYLPAWFEARLLSARTPYVAITMTQYSTIVICTHQPLCARFQNENLNHFCAVPLLLWQGIAT